jgi:hypothetical protein
MLGGKVEMEKGGGTVSMNDWGFGFGGGGGVRYAM